MRRVLIAPFVLAVACDGSEAQPYPERDLLPGPGEALGTAARLPDGTGVVARTGEAPGESDLRLIGIDGRERALAPAPGPDELPLALPDGRVVFVSGRSGVMSLWRVDPKSGVLEQLTNRGLRAGRLGADFVPPPARLPELSGDLLVYDAGGGVRVEFDLVRGAARVAR